MAGLGFDYLIRAASDDPDPNLEVMESLPVEEAHRFSLALWGTDVIDPTDSSCEAEATLRVFPINSLQSEWDVLQATVFSTPGVQAAFAIELRCVRGSGFDDVESATQEVVRKCEQESGILGELRAANEQLEVDFLNEHAQFFTSFKAQVPQP